MTSFSLRALRPNGDNLIAELVKDDGSEAEVEMMNAAHLHRPDVKLDIEENGSEVKLTFTPFDGGKPVIYTAEPNFDFPTLDIPAPKWEEPAADADKQSS